MALLIFIYIRIKLHWILIIIMMMRINISPLSSSPPISACSFDRSQILFKITQVTGVDTPTILFQCLSQTKKKDWKKNVFILTNSQLLLSIYLFFSFIASRLPTIFTHIFRCLNSTDSISLSCNRVCTYPIILWPPSQIPL